jgi:hypothetical protein
VPFKSFYTFLFDGNPKSKVPPDLLKYNSPITSQYAISLFMKNAPLNNYLDTWLNNIGLWYIDKEELFKFIKKAVNEFKVNRKDIFYIYKKKADPKLFSILSDRFPEYKGKEIEYFCELIENSKDRNLIYESLGLGKPKKGKKKGEIDSADPEEISVEDFLKNTFTIKEISVIK